MGNIDHVPRKKSVSSINRSIISDCALRVCATSIVVVYLHACTSGHDASEKDDRHTHELTSFHRIECSLNDTPPEKPTGFGSFRLARTSTSSRSKKSLCDLSMEVGPSCVDMVRLALLAVSRQVFDSGSYVAHRVNITSEQSISAFNTTGKSDRQGDSFATKPNKAKPLD